MICHLSRLCFLQCRLDLKWWKTLCAIRERNSSPQAERSAGLDCSLSQPFSIGDKHGHHLLMRIADCWLLWGLLMCPLGSIPVHSSSEEGSFVLLSLEWTDILIGDNLIWKILYQDEIIMVWFSFPLLLCYFAIWLFLPINSSPAFYDNCDSSRKTILFWSTSLSFYCNQLVPFINSPNNFILLYFLVWNCPDCAVSDFLFTLLPSVC